MLINELITVYEVDRKQSPKTLDDLLDFYQKKYIFEEIDILSYREIYCFLHVHGAMSAHEHMS